MSSKSINAIETGKVQQAGKYSMSLTSVLSPEIFLPLFMLGFYLVGETLVQFSFRALIIILLGVGSYLISVGVAKKLVGSAIGAIDSQNTSNSQDLQNKQSPRDYAGKVPYIEHDYFEHLLLSFLALFIVDIIAKGFLPFMIRVPLYFAIILFAFYIIKKTKLELSGKHFLALGLTMILIYVGPAFVKYGLYGSYLNRTGGLMPAFLVGMGTITTIYGLMKTASRLSNRNLYIMIAFITVVAGPLMAALIGYRAYAIIYILPLIFQYYLERKVPVGLKNSFIAISVIAFIFMYTYFATSVTRGVIYMFAPLDNHAPKFVVESMENGHYTDKDMRVDNAEARSKFITRPFFTYKVFLDVIEASYPWGKSHGRLIASLMPGMTKGRATTISILKKPLSTSFFGLSFLEFGFAGVAIYGVLLGFCLGVISLYKRRYIYALTLTIVMLWLDTGPSVWWHWLPFATAFPAFVSIYLTKGKLKNGSAKQASV
jgi:hypothetical protein